MLGLGQAVPNERLNHMRMTQAVVGLAVPIVFGTQRVPGILVWDGDFVATYHQVGGSSGFGAKGAALYTYSASWISLLCQGPISGINSIWDQSGQYIPTQEQVSVPILAAPAAPTLSYTAGGSLGTTTYYVTITYGGIQGSQSPPSAEASITVPPNNLLVVDSPASETNATGWFVYAAITSGLENLQSSEISIGTNWTELTGGLVSGGSGPPPPNHFKLLAQQTQWAADQGVQMNGAPMTRVPYDYLGGASVPTLTTGQYAVDGSGNYYFSSADAGSTVTIQDTYFYNNRITQELHNIPPSSPYTFEADQGGEATTPDGQSNVAVYVQDYGVRYFSSGVALTKVSGSPAAGQYSVSISGGYGTYTFNSADANQEVIIVYEYYNYQDDKYAPRTLSVTFFPGLLGQETWSYLTSAHPSQAIPYNESCYAAFQQAYLGMSASPPVHSFEVMGLDVIGGGVLDASPVDCLYRILTDPDIGIGFPSANIDNASWYSNSNSAETWCQSLGFFISQALTNQQTVASVCGRWLEAFQIAAFYSEGMLKLVPFGDQSWTGTYVGKSVEYIPKVSAVVSLDDNDFLSTSSKAKDPIKFTRSPWADAYNYVQLIYLNRLNAYNEDHVYEQDEAMIERFGMRPEPPTTYDFITSGPTAAAVANLRLKRNVTIRNTYTFHLSHRYGYLEPMDVVNITDTRLGLNAVPVRITRVVNNYKNGLTITAEDFPGNGYAMPTVNPKAITPAGHPPHGTNSAEQTNVVIVEAWGAGAGRETIRLYVFASGSSPNWAGCTVWVSLDDSNYQPIGTVTKPARVGTLLAQLPSVSPSPSGALGLTLDTTSTLEIQLSGVTATASTTGITDYAPGSSPAVGSLVVYDGTPWARLPGIGDPGVPTLSNTNWQKIQTSAPAGQDLISVTQSVAENLGTLAAVLSVSSGELTVSGIEFLSYETVSPGSGGPNTYNLTNLYRGAYGTEIQQFPAGSLFVVFKDASVTYDVPSGMVGGTVYFRFTAINSMGSGVQDVGNAQTFSFVVQGTGVAALEMTSDGLTSQGSLPTAGGDTSDFQYSIPSAATSVSFWWNAFTLPMTNGTNVSVAAQGSSGSPAITLTGLSPSTSYYFSARYGLLKQQIEIMVSTAATLTPTQTSQWLNADNYVPVFVAWNISTPASGGSGGSGSGGSGGGFCFTGETRVKTADGWKRFDELGPVVRIVNETGEWDADLVVHEDAEAEVVPLGAGHVTTNHLLRGPHGWTPAGELYPDAPREQFHGTLYNLHVRSEREADKHFVFDGGTAHNMKTL